MVSKKASKVSKQRKKENQDLTKDLDVLGVEYDLGIYELTEIFHNYYKYHNNDALIEYEAITGYDSKSRMLKTETKTLPRFGALRRLEAAKLGSRPFLSNRGITPNIPNISLGYLNTTLKYLTLPYKSVFTDSEWVRVGVNKDLYDQLELSDKEREDQRTQKANNPENFTNKDIGDAFSDAFSKVLKNSKKLKKAQKQMPLRVAQDGLIAFVHSDLGWDPDVVHAIDLVTEPQAEWDPENWSVFFVIKKMTAHEAVSHIKEDTKFWNGPALKWALESSEGGGSILNGTHYNHIQDEDSSKMAGENFMVKSYFRDKAKRQSEVGSYYGNMLVVEAYYYNKKGKINKAIFFPDRSFTGVSAETKSLRKSFNRADAADRNSEKFKQNLEELQAVEFADILFHRENVFDSMEEAITVVPFDRSEMSLERQRSYAFDMFAPIEMIMRLDSSILNLAILMGTPFVKNTRAGTDAENLEDLEININGGMADIGDKEFVTLPFSADLKGMLAVRNVLLQHVASQAFLGGLDGGDLQANGRGAQLANLRLIRDGRIHKNTVEDFADGLTDLLSKIFMSILSMYQKGTELTDDMIVQRYFFDTILKVHGYSDKILEFDKADILPDTGLPYQFNIQAIRNGGSHFGAAEVALYNEVRNLFGDGLDQQASQNLTRMGIKSLLGQQDAFDILGDPKDRVVTEQDQVYMARLESGAISGTVDGTDLDFQPIPIRPAKDDHVGHLTQVHLPDMQRILEKIQAGEVSPDEVEGLTETDLETRTNLILRLGAHSLHVQQHLVQLDRFGRTRDDINRLKEETNNMLQAAEGLINSLQVNIRALQQTRLEKEQRLKNISPENEAEKAKIELELAKIQAKRASDDGKLSLANKIADQRQSQHIDKQVSRARDRELKRAMARADVSLRQQELVVKGRESTSNTVEE